MTIKKTILATSLLLAMGASFNSFAETKAEEAMTIECITAAEVEAMSEEDKAKLTLPLCEDVQNEKGATTTQ